MTKWDLKRQESSPVLTPTEPSTREIYSVCEVTEHLTYLFIYALFYNLARL